jgi:ribose transport system substrate-binding protein
MGMAVAMTGLMGTALMGTAHAADKKVTIGVSIPAADHGWTAGVVYHANRVAKLLMAEHPGLNVIVKTSPDAASQANALEDLTTQGMNALVILPSNPDPLVNAIKQVKSKGIFVTLVDRAPSNNDNSVRDLYVAGNNPALGAVAGEYIKKHTPDAQVVVIRGLPIPIDQQRQDGFDNAIKGSNVKVLEKQFGNWNRDDAFKVMQDYLTKYPKIDVVWCQDDDMAVGVLQAIQQAKRTDIKYIIAGAGSKDMVKKVMDGDKLVPVDVLYPPAMIGTAMELTAANFYDQVPVRGTYIMDATLITKENAKEFYFPDSPF